MKGAQITRKVLRGRVNGNRNKIRDLYGDKLRVFKRKKGRGMTGNSKILYLHKSNQGLFYHEVRHYQKETGVVIPRTSFNRVAKEILESLNSPYVKHFSAEAYAACQFATEAMLTTWFEML